MRMISVNKKDFKTTEWSGGSTTEYFIYPEDSAYADRKFKARISSAVIEDEKSVFTYLEGVERYLAPLEGDVTLKINDESVILFPYDIIQFYGNDTVLSEGCCRDFNLMLKHTGGGMQSVKVYKDSNYEYTISGYSITVIYCFEGEAEILGDSCKKITDRDNMVVIFNEENKEESVTLSSDNKNIIICDINI